MAFENFPSKPVLRKPTPEDLEAFAAVLQSEGVTTFVRVLEANGETLMLLGIGACRVLSIITMYQRGSAVGRPWGISLIFLAAYTAGILGYRADAGIDWSTTRTGLVYIINLFLVGIEFVVLLSFRRAARGSAH